MTKYEQLMSRVNSINFSKKDRIEHGEHFYNWKEYIEKADYVYNKDYGEFKVIDNNGDILRKSSPTKIAIFYNTFPNIDKRKPVGKECISPNIDKFNPILYEPSEKSYKELDMLECELGMLEYTIDENDDCDTPYKMLNRLLIHKGATFTKYNKKEGKYCNNNKDIYTIAITEFDTYYQNQHVVVFHNNNCVEWWIGCDDSILNIWDYVWDKYSYPFVE